MNSTVDTSYSFTPQCDNRTNLSVGLSLIAALVTAAVFVALAYLGHISLTTAYSSAAASGVTLILIGAAIALIRKQEVQRLIPQQTETISTEKPSKEKDPTITAALPKHSTFPDSKPNNQTEAIPRVQPSQEKDPTITTAPHASFCSPFPGLKPNKKISLLPYEDSKFIKMNSPDSEHNYNYMTVQILYNGEGLEVELYDIRAPTIYYFHNGSKYSNQLNPDTLFAVQKEGAPKFEVGSKYRHNKNYWIEGSKLPFAELVPFEWIKLNAYEDSKYVKICPPDSTHPYCYMTIQLTIKEQIIDVECIQIWPALNEIMYIHNNIQYTKKLPPDQKFVDAEKHYNEAYAKILQDKCLTRNQYKALFPENRLEGHMWGSWWNFGYGPASIFAIKCHMCGVYPTDSQTFSVPDYISHSHDNKTITFNRRHETGPVRSIEGLKDYPDVIAKLNATSWTWSAPNKILEVLENEDGTVTVNYTKDQPS